MRIDPESAPRLENSPVRRILEIFDTLFSAAPQPRAKTAAAKRCGELLGRHLISLLRSCGELNLMGLHSAALPLFRPQEDALDCLAAVTIIAGAAERWESGKLKPSDAAKLWYKRFDLRHPVTQEALPNYRKELRGVFSKFSHCNPFLLHWDLFRDRHLTDESLFRLKVNHESLVILSNAYRIDAYLVARCYESLQIIELAYSEYLQHHPVTNQELKSLKNETERILRKYLKDGLLGSIVPPEIEALYHEPHEDNSIQTEIPKLAGKWIGHWKCSSGQEVDDAKLSLHQEGRLMRGSLVMTVSDGEHSFKITEELSGVIQGEKLLLDGTTSEVRPSSAERKYQLDTFELEYSIEETELKGLHMCPLGQGGAVFEKKQKASAKVKG